MKRFLYKRPVPPQTLWYSDEDREEDRAGHCPPHWVNSTHCSHSVGSAHWIKLGLFVSRLSCQECSVLAPPGSECLSHFILPLQQQFGSAATPPSSLTELNWNKRFYFSPAGYFGTPNTHNHHVELPHPLSPAAPVETVLYVLCSGIFHNVPSGHHDITF